MNQCSLKHFPLPGGREAGDENHKPGMKSLLAVKCDEIRSIVSDKNILARVNSGYQLPIFVAAEPEKIHVITVVTAPCATVTSEVCKHSSMRNCINCRVDGA